MNREKKRIPKEVRVSKDSDKIESQSNSVSENIRENASTGILESNNTESIKLDSNGDEIVWELKIEKNLSEHIVLWLVRFIMLGIFMYIFVYCIGVFYEKLTDSTTIFRILYQHLRFWNCMMWLGLSLASFYIFIIYLREIYLTLNLKSMYIQHNNLIITRYIGNDIIAPLGSFYIRKITNIFTYMYADSLCMPIVNNKLGGIYTFLNPLCQTNIFDINNIAKEQIEYNLTIISMTLFIIILCKMLNI